MRKIAFIAPLMSILVASVLVQSAFAYDNLEHNFSITPPSGWTTEEQEGMIVVLFGDPSIFKGASINIAVEETRATFSEYIQASKLGLETLLSGFVLDSEGSRIIGEKDCYQLEYTYTMLDFEFRVSQFLFLARGKAYAITCACLSDYYLETFLDFENCVSTFRIGESANTNDNNMLIIGVIVVYVILTVAILLAIVFLRKRKKESPSLTNQMTDAQVTKVSVSVTTSPKFCRYCGAETKSDAAYCDNCGKKISE